MIWIAALVIGIIDAVVLYLFEVVGIEGPVWLWDEVLGTDEYRWRVIPVAVVLGLVLTATFKLVGQPRVKDTTGDLLEELDNTPSSLSNLGAVLLIGAVSLLAGASLGPEASLMAFSSGLGTYIAARMKLGSSKQVLVLASVGALLVAFINSIVLVAIPLLILLQGWKKANKKPQLRAVAVVLLAGLVSYAVIGLIYNFHGGGHSLMPTLAAPAPQDFVVALVLGFVTGILALVLTRLIGRFSGTAREISGQIPGGVWWLGAGAGLVLGVLYYLGGQTVQFSGKIGISLLVENAAHFGVAALATMILVKLLATAWSEGTGYRGGLVFSSIYVGVATGLLFLQLFPELGGTGATVGALSGMLTAVIGSPVMAAVFLIAILPPALWPLAAFAIIGTLCFSRLRAFMTKKKLVA